MNAAFYLTASGRASRRQIWLWYVLPYLALSTVLGIADQALFPREPGEIGPLGALLMIAALVPSIMIQVKRFHDIGLSGWWVLWFGLAAFSCLMVAVIPHMASGAGDPGLGEALNPEAPLEPLTGPMSLVSTLGFLGMIGFAIAQFYLLYGLRGQPRANIYGPDPLAGRAQA